MPLRRLTLLPFLASLALGAAPEARIDERHRAFLKEYCVECHNADKQKGKLRLDDIPFTLDTVQWADRWQKILNQVNSGEMPPEEAKQPALTAKADFLETLSGTLVTARKTIGDSRGQITMRRLNRREYKNSLRDLLGVDLPVNELPADGGAGAFDTVGAALFMSSDQFERYLALGHQAIDEHFIRYRQPTKNLKVHIEAEDHATPRIAKSYAGRVDCHERYVAWTKAVDEAAARPDNAAVVAAIQAEKKGDATHRYYEWKRIPGAPSPEKFGYVDEIHADQQGRRNWVLSAPQQKAYLDHPASKSGAFLTYSDVFANPHQPFNVPSNWPAGRYTIRVRVAGTANTPKSRHFLEFGPLQGAVASTHEVTGTMEKPQLLEFPVDIVNGGSRGFFLRERGAGDSNERALQIFGEAHRRNGIGPEFALWIDWIEVFNAEVAPAALKERREVELHANRMVGGTYDGYYKGGNEAAKAFLATGQPQKGIPDKEEANFRIKVFGQHGPSFARYLDDPLTKTGAYLTIFNVHPEEVITLPPDQPSGWLKTKHEVESITPGLYMLRFRIGAVKDSPKERRFVELGSRKSGDKDFTLLRAFQVDGTTDAPQVIEFPVDLTFDGPRTFVLREKRDVRLDSDLYNAAQKATGVGPPAALWIDWVEWEGPLKPEVSPPPVARRIEPETKRAEIEREHRRYSFLNDQFAKWKAAGADEKRLKEFGFNDRSHAEFSKTVWDSNRRWYQQYLDRPLSLSGLYLDNTVGPASEYAVDLPADAPIGDYVMRVRIGRTSDTPAERAFLTFVEASPIDKDDRTFLANKQVAAGVDAPEIVEFPFKVRAGGARKFILMEKRPLKKETISLPGRSRLIADPKLRDPALWIDWLEYVGPLKATDPQAAAPVLTANTDGLTEREHARQIVATFAARAFRGKSPSPGYVDKLVALYEARRKAGDGFEQALKEPLSAILASPGFLYLAEPNDGRSARPLDANELAVRLSYFLWSAPPDETLLALARAGDLKKPDVLAREVDRMLASPKADEFVRGFVHQWLGLARLDFFQFDTKQFRDFDESTKAASRQEVYETFAHLLRQQESLSKLIKNDQVYVNGLLANYYGLDGVAGDGFRKVDLPKGSPRGGLLGMAAILAMGSNGHDTSPVERGAWILRKILHEPPPPAPPNVPQLNRLENKVISTRERLAAHQEQPQCAQCHRKIDPIGFGLENFNAAGKWRTSETYEKKGFGSKTWPIDPAGAFYKGESFRDYFELRDRLADRPEKFARGFSEALIEYGMGRPFGFLDEPLAADMIAQARAQDYRMATFIRALVLSETFQTK